MEHKGTKRLETERLILRPFVPEDAEAMYRNWASDPEVTKFLTWPPHESASASWEIIARWTAESETPGFYQWAVELKDLGEPVGSISVVRMDDTVRAAELGYCIGRRWWGQGLTAEALRAVIAYLIREAGMNRVAACHDSLNPNSGRVMQKAGMRKEGVLRDAVRNNRGIVDGVWYSILAAELED